MNRSKKKMQEHISHTDYAQSILSEREDKYSSVLLTGTNIEQERSIDSHQRFKPLLFQSPAKMKISFAFTSILATSTLALTIKRQNNVPSCEDGDATLYGVAGQYSSCKYTIEGLPGHSFVVNADLRSSAAASCENDCYMAEKSGDRVELLCKGYCTGAGVSFVFGAPAPPPSYTCSGKA